MSGAGVLDEKVEPDVHLDWNPLCDWGGIWKSGLVVSPPGCHLEAAWIGISLCCGLVRFYCQQHRTERDVYVASYPKAAHIPCGAPGSLIRWEPLKGNT